MGVHKPIISKEDGIHNHFSARLKWNNKSKAEMEALLD